MSGTIRDARPDDLEPMLRIYNEVLLGTAAIWDETPRSASDQLAWIRGRQDAGLPVLVAELAGEVVGYTSYGPFRGNWSGYRHTVEHSIFVAGGMRRRGLGRLLLTAIVDRARGQGLHVTIGGIEAGNEASLRLHEKLGFTEAGRLRQVGWKFGRWLDLVFVQKVLS